MRSLWISLRLLIAVLAAVVIVIGRRLSQGPLVPGWTWGLEYRRETLRALLETGARIGRPERWADLHIEAPVPRKLRGLITVAPDTVNGVDGEWLRLPPLPARPVLLYVHGGGFVIGSPGMERPFISHLAAAARADAFSVDYRLSPRHVFPAALVDVTKVYLGLLDRGIEPERIVVTGDSAGGNLAAALLVRLRDEGLPLPGAAVLLSAWLDLALTGSTVWSNAATDYLPIVDAQPALHYLGDDTDPAAPWASPLYADLNGLPPMLVVAGGREIILDDSTRFVERAWEAGVDATLYIEEDMFHAWASVVPNHPVSQRTFTIVADWIESHRSCVV